MCTSIFCQPSYIIDLISPFKNHAIIAKVIQSHQQRNKETSPQLSLIFTSTVKNYDSTQLLYIDMGIGVLTIQKSLKFFKIGIKSCRKHKNYVALDCGLGYRDPKCPKGVPWDQNFWSKIFLISSSNDLILWVLWIG